MKFTVRRTTIMLVALFTLSTTALGHESNKTPTTAPEFPTLDAKKVDPSPTLIDLHVITMADKILVEQAEAEARGLRGISNLRHNPKSTGDPDSLVDEWLEEHAGHGHGAAASQPRAHSHYDEIELEMGGGWCDICGCWLGHGNDPYGTPKEVIGHSHVCNTSGGSSCPSHSFRNCFSS